MKNLYRRLTLLLALAPAATVCGESEKPITTIEYGSCCHQGRSQWFWAPIISSKPDVFIFCGDNIYGDTHSMAMLRDKYGQLVAQPGFRKLNATSTVLATWDDHDYGMNDGGGDFPEKVESRRIFFNVWRVPTDSPRRKHNGVYDAQILGPPGKRVQIILLDTRYFRSPLVRLAVERGRGHYAPNNDPKATLLGEEQWAWLAQQLRKPAELRLLVSSIQIVSQDHDWEKWMNFPNERVRLIRLIHDTKANGLVVLSGDRHHAELSVLRSALIGYPLYDLTSSGLNMSYIAPRKEPNRHRVGEGPISDNNFGAVHVDWNKRDPTVTIDIHTVKNQVPISKTFPLSSLKPN